MPWTPSAHRRMSERRKRSALRQRSDTSDSSRARGQVLQEELFIGSSRLEVRQIRRSRRVHLPKDHECRLYARFSPFNATVNCAKGVAAMALRRSRARRDTEYICATPRSSFLSSNPKGRRTEEDSQCDPCWHERRGGRFARDVTATRFAGRADPLITFANLVPFSSDLRVLQRPTLQPSSSAGCWTTSQKLRRPTMRRTCSSALLIHGCFT